MSTDDLPQIKRIKIKISEGQRKGTSLIKYNPTNYQELKAFVDLFLQENNYEPWIYSLNYFDGEEFMLLKNNQDFQSALEDTPYNNTLLLEIQRKDEEELQDAISDNFDLNQQLKKLNQPLSLTTNNKLFSFQEEIQKCQLSKKNQEISPENQKQQFINQAIDNQLPMLSFQNDRFWSQLQKIDEINPSYFDKIIIP